MPRPVPAPENQKVRTTISLPRKVVALTEAYIARHPEENFADFSAVVSRALIDYASRKHPDLLAECIRDIQLQAKAPGGTAVSRDPKIQHGKDRPEHPRKGDESRRKRA